MGEAEVRNWVTAEGSYSLPLCYDTITESACWRESNGRSISCLEDGLVVVKGDQETIGTEPGIKLNSPLEEGGTRNSQVVSGKERIGSIVMAT